MAIDSMIRELEVSHLVSDSKTLGVQTLSMAFLCGSLLDKLRGLWLRNPMESGQIIDLPGILVNH
jgi:hypothetical protein